MNRPPKSKKKPTSNSSGPAKAPDRVANIKNQKIDTTRMGVRARATGSARGK